ncbi:SpoIIE family protein phosphatase [uncultured Microscilla sp.]|uniref:SpoIIE family protein phosphatase n=1 Tax=uncultured Microscilla sp. TaxID=432653 RepID=UPI002618DA22|nr:SpoIIE family protein phosphatase [uncultured Microscilla sp.]
MKVRSVAHHGLFQSIRSKLLIAFSAFSLIAFSIVFVFFWLERRQHRIEDITKSLTRLNLQINDVNSLEKDFFSDDVFDKNFYVTGKSDYLLKHTDLLEQIKRELTLLSDVKDLQRKQLAQEIVKVNRQINKLEKLFEQLVQIIRTKGFKDVGLQGDMQKSIGQLFKKQPEYNLTEVYILKIRKHEKDFIIAKEIQYVEKLKQAVEVVRQEVKQKVQDGQAQAGLLNDLNTYQQAFLDLVKIEKRIGFHNQSGLKKKLNDSLEELEKNIQQIDTLVFDAASRVRTIVKYTLVILLIFFVILSMVLGYFVNHKFGKPIARLSNSINWVIQNNFNEDSKIYQINNKDEIGRLANDFQHMLEAVQARTEEVMKQKNLLEKKNHDITKSINYAKRIQDAKLPQLSTIQEVFPQSFIMLKPRDVISGDFYWFSEVVDKNGDTKYVIACSDCTGHGVPGAFMSMIGSDLLNETVHENNVIEPHLILNTLHDKIRKALKQRTTGNRDGMDISIVVIDKKKQVMEFAGANTPIVYIQNHELTLIKGDKEGIGGLENERDRDFTHHTIKLRPKLKTSLPTAVASHLSPDASQKEEERYSPTTFYIFSDGYQDQFGGAKGRKFMLRRMTDLFMKIYQKPMSEQHEIMERTLANWANGQRQIDDILVMGIHLP